MNSPPSYRVIIIDDTPAIHEDFRKVFARPTAEVDSLDATATAIFDVRPEETAPSTEFSLDSALQGQEGAELVQSALAAGRPYALAFVDMRMPPGWDGLETIQRLWKIDRRLQIVLCTAHSDHSWHKIHSVLGRSDSLIVLKKPFDQIEARQLAHALAEKWWLARENERRLAEMDALVQERTRALRVAEDRFSRAFEANPAAQAVFALDPFEVLEVNSAFVKQFGFSLAQLRGETPESFGRGLDPTRWRGLIGRLIAGGQVDEHAYSFERSPGDVRELKCSARLVEIGGRACSIWMIRDVTEHLRLEQQFRQAQKMDAVGQLAAGIAHDFNNLLTVIQTYTGLILADTSGGPPPREELQSVLDASNRAAALTRQLLVFSRRQITKPEPLNMAAAFQSIRALLERLLPERIKLEWKVSDTLPAVLADVTNLEQVIMNLVINARDATVQHGVITVTLTTAHLTDSDRPRHPRSRAGTFVVLSVGDTGGGMTPEVMARIFEPFFTTKESGKGTGLGLSTVYGIVEQHQGWIEVASVVGQGTTFLVYLPALPGSEMPSVTPRQSVSAAEGWAAGERILIVEDDPSVRGAASRIAASAGFAVTEAEDGRGALQAWQQSGRGFDLVFSDVVLPNGISGIDLARQLRRDKPGVRIVLATGYSEQILRGEALDLEDVAVLLKPYTIEELLAALGKGAGARESLAPVSPG